MSYVNMYWRLFASDQIREKTQGMKYVFWLLGLININAHFSNRKYDIDRITQFDWVKWDTV